MDICNFYLMSLYILLSAQNINEKKRKACTLLPHKNNITLNNAGKMSVLMHYLN